MKTFAILCLLGLLLVGCSPVASLLRGAADGIDGIDTRPDDDPARTEPISNLAYAGGGLAMLVLGSLLGGKFVLSKRVKT